MQSGVIPIIPADVARLRRRERPRGRPPQAAVRDEVLQWLGEPPTRRELLIEHLHVINDRLGCLPAPHLVALAALMKLPQAEVFEVASFYHHFEIIKEGPDGVLPPLPGLRVRVCDGLPCALAGADALRVRLAALLGPQVQVIAAPCVGRCETAPVAVVHQHAVTHATDEAVLRAVQNCQTAPAATAPIDLDAYRAQGGYALLRECMAGARDPLQLIELLESAGLRGLGGAGFPAGRKWRIVRAQPAPRLMAVNLDEGEPGTFKDRVLLESDPHRFIEGLWVAAWAVGVAQVTVYLRDEYHGCRQMLQAELARLRAEPPADGLPGIVLRRGAGAYICGARSRP